MLDKILKTLSGIEETEDLGYVARGVEFITNGLRKYGEGAISEVQLNFASQQVEDRLTSMAKTSKDPAAKEWLDLLAKIKAKRRPSEIASFIAI